MIEIINAYDTGSTGELEEVLELPKNVRQIGEQINNKKIYIEDYVYTYLYHYAASDLDNPVVAILLGKYQKKEEDKILFISGAVKAKYYLNDNSGLVMTNETWGYIYEEIKQYFNGYDIVGWFVSRPGFGGEINDQIYRIHISNFTGQDKLLYVIDPVEKEDCFYLYESNQLKQQKGYYIYYERNEIMQSYMLENRVQEEKTIEEQEAVVQNFRRVVQTKRQEADQKKIVNLLYATSTALAIIVLVIGIALLNNYDKMRSLENIIQTISNSIQPPDESEPPGVPEGDPQGDADPAIGGEKAEGDGIIEVEVAEGNLNTGQGSDGDDIAELPEAPEPPVVTEPVDPPDPEGQPEEPVDVPEEPEVVETISTPEPRTYTIKHGDSLESISWKYYKDRKRVQEIQILNGIANPDKIYEGQVILLP